MDGKETAGVTLSPSEFSLFLFFLAWRAVAAFTPTSRRNAIYFLGFGIVTVCDVLQFESETHVTAGVTPPRPLSVLEAHGSADCGDDLATITE